MIIPFDKLWEQYHRIIKDNGAIVLTASQPFTSMLVMSNIKNFKYEWIWEKTRPTGFINCKNAPLKKHENILIFSKGKTSNCNNKNMKYFPQGITDSGVFKKSKYDKNDILGTRPCRKNNGYVQQYKNYPTSILKFNSEIQSIHPTQKPVALFEYLIKTYTNENDLVLDNCAGSGTTAIACLNTNRNYILMEKEQKYIDIIKDRIANHTQQLGFKGI